jgi:hypothetical protein
MSREAEAIDSGVALIFWVDLGRDIHPPREGRFPFGRSASAALGRPQGKESSWPRKAARIPGAAHAWAYGRATMHGRMVLPYPVERDVCIEKWICYLTTYAKCRMLLHRSIPRVSSKPHRMLACSRVRSMFT